MSCLKAVDDGLSQGYSSSEAGTKIIVGEASLVQLVLLHEGGSAEIINTTDEHPFHVADTAAWTRADQLIVGDELSTITGTAKLQSVIYTTERVPVYNLSIPGSPTYYVGENGVWVHNASCFSLIGVTKVRKSELMRKPRIRGNAPIGSDGNAIQIHHVGQNIDGPFVEVTAATHRGIENPLAGLTAQERRDFNSARKQYWIRQWDEGRFDSLPNY